MNNNPSLNTQKSADPLRWKALIFICLSLLVICMDNTVLNVALPSLAETLGASASQLQWIVDGYILVFAALLLTMGALGDRIGRKRLLQVGLAWFGAGSILAGVSQSATMLIAARVFLGIGGAMVLPSTLSIITATFQDSKERSKAIGMWSAIFGIGSALGPLIGGTVVQLFSWQAVFFINIPLIAAALWGGGKTISESRDPESRPIDFPGAVLSVLGLFALVYGIIEAGLQGWGDRMVLISFLCAAVLLIAFFIRQATAKHPMLPLDLFRNPSFSVANLELVLGMFALFGTLFFLTQYLQSVLGFSAVKAGTLLLPISLFSILGSMVSSKLTGRFQLKRTITIGISLAAVGLIGLSLLAEVDSSYLRISPALAVFALGLGILWPAATDSVMASVPPAKSGIGSAMNDTTRQLGAALGVAVLGTLGSSGYLAALRGSDLNSLGMDVTPRIYEGLQSALAAISGADFAGADQLLAYAREAFVFGMDRALLVSGILLAAGAVLGIVLLPAKVGPGVERD